MQGDGDIIPNIIIMRRRLPTLVGHLVFVRFLDQLIPERKVRDTHSILTNQLTEDFSLLQCDRSIALMLTARVKQRSQSLERGKLI